MKWGLRAVFFLLLAAGVLFGIGLPRAVERLPGYEIDRLTLYSAEAGFTPAQVMLAPPEAPFFLTLAVRSNAPLRAGEGRAAFTLTLRGENGETAFEQVFGFPHDPVLETGGAVYLEMVVLDRPLDGRHTAAVDVKPRLDPSIAAIELAVNAGAFDLDPRLQPAGFILLIVGGIGLVLSFGRRGEPPPPPPRWGRDAA